MFAVDQVEGGRTVGKMANQKLILYFDLHSPFAYLAFHVIRVSAEAKERAEYLLTLVLDIPNLSTDRC
jgi:2-hydroxychromene-2-carboxylate isomerase